MVFSRWCPYGCGKKVDWTINENYDEVLECRSCGETFRDVSEYESADEAIIINEEWTQ